MCVRVFVWVCNVRVQASVKRSRSPPRIGKQDASFALEVCVCVFSSAADSNKEEEGWARRERKCVRVWACVCVLAARRKSPVQQLSKRHNPPPAHTHSMNTHTHTSSTCGEYYSSFITFSHSIPPSLLPSLALSFSLICSELNYTRMHTHIHADSKNTHTSLLSFPSELQSGR